MAILQVQTNWTGPSAPLLSTMYFDPNFGTQNAADAVRQFWADLNTVIRGTFVAQVNPEVRTLNEVNGQLVAVSAVTTAPVTMTDTGDILDLLQGMIRFFTDTVVDGRQVKGRIFIPGPTEAVNDATGRPSPTAYLGTLTTAAGNLIGDPDSQLQVWHRPLFDADGNLIRDGSAHDVTGQQASTAWSYLRTRRI